MTLGGLGAAVVGVGHSPVYRFDDVPLGVLAVDAAMKAIQDAGLTANDIQGVIADPEQPFDGAGLIDGIHRVSPEYLINSMHLDVWMVESMPYTTISRTIIAAANTVASGCCTAVLVYRALHNPRGQYGLTAPTSAAGMDQFTAPYGLFPPGMFGQVWQRYMSKYGTTREQMGPFVIASRKNGLMWQHGYWYQHNREELTTEQYVNERMVSAPIGLYDCDLPVQGCGAFVLTSAERALDLPHPPAYIRGWAHPGSVGGWGHYSTLEVMMERASHCATQLYANAGIGPSDVDVANLYDGFSVFPALWLEAFRFCGEGEAFDFMVPENIAIRGGILPLNPSGGNLGAGRMHGVPHVMESVLQVTGRSGPRQVPGAQVALCTAGSQPGNSPAIVFSSSLD